MAIRSPLVNDSGNIKEMSSAQVNQIIDQVVYQYSLNPSVSLSVVNSGGSLGSISDTRLQAGAMSTHNSAFPNEATTEEPSVVTVTYDKVSQARASVSPTGDTGTTWPVYYNASGQIQAMSLVDVKDTFLHPAINLLTAATTTTQQGGTYHINTATSVAGSTLVSATPIFVDSRTDTSLYTDDAAGLGFTRDKTYSSGGANGSNVVEMNNTTDLTVGMTIFKPDNTTLPDKTTDPTYITNINGNELTLSQNFIAQASGTYTIGSEALDQSTTITSYYLHRINGSNTAYTVPFYSNAQNNLQEFAPATFQTLLQGWIRNIAVDSAEGYQINYFLSASGAGQVRGTGMPDTRLNGTGNYKTFEVLGTGGDDYRAQEFPDGTPTTVNTYYLRINKS